MTCPATEPAPPQLDDAQWLRRAALLVGAVLAARIVCIALVPLDLVPDEAYYWAWSRVPDWCYYSKPPMVAWLIAASTHLLGTTAFSVRLPAALLNAGMVAALFALGRAMFSARAGFLAALAFALAPGCFALGMLMTIDPPLLCCWAVALLAFWRAIQPGSARAWWLAAGGAVAAGFLSKQMMLVFPVLAVAFLVTSRGYRRILLSPWFYLFILIGLCGLVPVLWWNSQHEWVILQHSSKHFKANRHALDFAATFFQFIGTQAVVMSPVLWPLLVVAGVASLGTFRRQSDAVRFLLLFSMVPLSVFALMSFRQKILPNWPAVYYLAGCVLGAAWACGFVSCGTLVDKARRLFVPGLWLGLGFTAIACALLSFVGFTGIGEQLFSKQLSGWKELGGDVGRVIAAQPDTNRLLLIAKDRELASELAFYLPNRPHVYEWPLDIVVYSQYHLWQRSFDKTNGTCDMLLAWEPKRPVACLPLETAWFARVDFVASITSGARQVELYRGRNLSYWRPMKYHLPKPVRP